MFLAADAFGALLRSLSRRERDGGYDMNSTASLRALFYETDKRERTATRGLAVELLAMRSMRRGCVKSETPRSFCLRVVLLFAAGEAASE